MSVIMRILIACLIVIGCITIALWLKSNHYKVQAETLTEQLTAKTAELELLSANAELTEEAYQALLASEIAVTEKYAPAIKKVHSAPVADDAPIAPVLRSALEGL